MNARRMNSDDVRNDWEEVVGDVRTGGTVLIEEANQPIAAVIPFEDFVALREQLEDLHDIRSADAAHAEYKRDPSTARTLDDLIAEWDAMDAAQGNEAEQ